MSLPVDLESATKDHSVEFHQYERGTSDRIRYRRINEHTGKEVEDNDIVKGRAIHGQVVTVEQSELDDIAPGRSRAISITTFVEVDEIDPVYFDTTYWLAPGSADHQRPYNLLRQAMAQTHQAGIATFVLRGKQHLALIRAEDQALVLHTLRWPNEIRDPADVVGKPATADEPSEDEMHAATAVITAMSGTWRPGDYEDAHTARIEQLLQEKAQGRQPEAAEPTPPEPTPVKSLEEALRESLASAKAPRRTANP